MAIIIFDFDDTLFETHKLKDSIFKKIKSFGVPHETILSTYKEAVEKFDHYTPINHISIINEMDEFNIPDYEIKKINNIDFSFHEIDETRKILLDLSKDHTLILLTLGDRNFQELKIINSGFASCFNEIHIVSKKKENFLKEKNFQGDVYFVNDKKSENEIIRKMFPHIQVIDFDIKNQGSLSRLPFIS